MVVIGKDGVLQSQVYETKFHTWQSFHKLNLLKIRIDKLEDMSNFREK